MFLHILSFSIEAVIEIKLRFRLIPIMTLTKFLIYGMFYHKPGYSDIVLFYDNRRNLLFLRIPFFHYRYNSCLRYVCNYISIMFCNPHRNTHYNCISEFIYSKFEVSQCYKCVMFLDLVLLVFLQWILFIVLSFSDVINDKVIQFMKYFVFTYSDFHHYFNINRRASYR